MDVTLQKIKEKILSEERITEDECLQLYQSNDLIALGEIANIVRERKNGQRAYFNINRHLNYSNVCYVDCKFCEFGQPKNSAKAYHLELEEMKKTAILAQEQNATELHIVGGLHPDLKFSYYTGLLSELKKVAPKLHLKAFTAV
ncbi:MAG: aminofutalosine synthase MqnE, partial [Deltaproteobacteria bacterium]|nr:aminofutalosine synthase MqnE [Deltaproteobacteria bacterium]